jgi:hypothetical protein
MDEEGSPLGESEIIRQMVASIGYSLSFTKQRIVIRGQRCFGCCPVDKGASDFEHGSELLNARTTRLIR